MERIWIVKLQMIEKGVETKLKLCQHYSAKCLKLLQILENVLIDSCQNTKFQLCLILPESVSVFQVLLRSSTWPGSTRWTPARWAWRPTSGASSSEATSTIRRTRTLTSTACDMSNVLLHLIHLMYYYIWYIWCITILIYHIWHTYLIMKMYIYIWYIRCTTKYYTCDLLYLIHPIYYTWYL